MKNKFFLIVLNTMLLILTSRVFAQTQLGSDIDGEAATDYSGGAVSIDSDGDRVAIGAPVSYTHLTLPTKRIV